MRFPPLPRIAWFAIVALVSALGPVASAHDPLEITAEVRVRSDHLEFLMVLARSTAAYASAKDEADRRRFEPQEFEKVKPRLIACAPLLFVFRAGEETLVARTVAVAMTIEDDVELRLTFPRPASGKLVVKGQIFSILPAEGYGSTFQMHGPKGELLANKFINAEDPFVEATLPAAPTSAAPPGHDHATGFAVHTARADSES